jgi:hypothetical protein
MAARPPDGRHNRPPTATWPAIAHCALATSDGPSPLWRRQNFVRVAIGLGPASHACFPVRRRSKPMTAQRSSPAAARLDLETVVRRLHESEIRGGHPDVRCRPDGVDQRSIAPRALTGFSTHPARSPLGLTVARRFARSSEPVGLAIERHLRHGPVGGSPSAERNRLSSSCGLKGFCRSGPW